MENISSFSLMAATHLKKVEIGQCLQLYSISSSSDSLLDITARAQEHFQKSPTVNTVCCAMKKCQLKLYRAKKPSVNMTLSETPLSSLGQSSSKSEAKYEIVLWTDESKCDFFRNHRRHVLWTKKDRSHLACCQWRVQKPSSLMVWGYISAYGVGSLHIWKC